MLKKKYNGKIVAVISLIAFACIVLIIMTLNNAYHFEKLFYVALIVLVGMVTLFLALRVTIMREASVVIQPADYPPENINPLQAGIIVDGKANGRDVAALFFYLAQKGYMDIIEYELKKFEFTCRKYPEAESKTVQMLFSAIFSDKAKASGTGMSGITVKLEDVVQKLIISVPKIEEMAYKGISNKRNREIADITGKVIGFRDSLTENRDEKAQELTDADADYFFKVVPYAYAFSITSKLSRNFAPVKIAPPKWYKPYGIENDYEFDVVIYNSMLRNLPQQLEQLVFSKCVDTYPNITSA